MRIQKSRYNYFVEYGDNFFGYNARTGNFAVFTKEVKEKLDNDLIQEISIQDELLEMGFIQNGDEIESVLSNYSAVRSNKNLMHLTLVPTLDCNLSCPYCFQNKYRDDRVMSKDTQDAVIQFIENRIKEGRKDISCVWFGGEPLLQKNTVIEMSSRINELVSFYNANLHGGFKILTNGVFLDGETAKSLSNVNIHQAQVSLDNLVYNGSTTRGVIDKNGNSSLLLNNILEAREHLKIDIRINVSENNVNDVPQIMEILDKHDLKGSYGLARVHDHEEESGYERKGSCCSNNSNDQFSKMKIKLKSNTLKRPTYARFEQENFLKRQNSLREILKKLKPKKHFCAATQGHMFVIDPAGYVSRCWHSAGMPEEAISNVHETLDSCEDNINTKVWLEYSPLRYKSCESCKVLPLCMGGCAHPRIFMDAQKPPCESIKQQIQFCVDEVAQMTKIEYSSTS